MEIKTVCEKGYEPMRAHSFDAGADLCAKLDSPFETLRVPYYKTAMVRTGVRAQIPEGYVGLLFARSSLCKKGLLMANGVGVVDAGYTGEIMVPLRSMAGRPLGEIKDGERIAQLVIVPCMLPKFEQVESLGDTERGEGGFGSTGVE